MTETKQHEAASKVDASKQSMPIEFYPPDGHPADPPKGPPANFRGETFHADAPGKGTPPAPTPTTYGGKKLDELWDSEVLQLAGVYGPSIISQELYDRAQKIQKTNPGGVFGPAILKADYFQSQSPPTPSPAPKPAEEESADASGDDPSGGPWHSYSIKDLQKIAQQEGVSHKPKASRDDLISALEEAGVQPPPISDFETYHGPRSG